MKTPLGTEVDLGQGHTVLDGDPAPPPAKGAHLTPLLAHVMSRIVATVARLSYCMLQAESLLAYQPTRKPTPAEGVVSPQCVSE